MEIRGDDVGVQPFRLVDREEDRLARAAQFLRDESILRGQPGARIDEQHEAVRLLDRALGLHAHLRFDAGWVLDETAGIDGDVGNRAEAPESVLPVARDARHVRDDGVARAGQCIEERRLADVRTAYQRDDGQHDVLIGRARYCGGGGGVAGSTGGGGLGGGASGGAGSAGAGVRQELLPRV